MFQLNFAAVHYLTIISYYLTITNGKVAFGIYIKEKFPSSIVFLKGFNYLLLAAITTHYARLHIIIRGQRNYKLHHCIHISKWFLSKIRKTVNIWIMLLCILIIGVTKQNSGLVWQFSAYSSKLQNDCARFIIIANSCYYE